MCPPYYHHNGFMATPELWHILLCIFLGSQQVQNEGIYM